MNIDDNCFLILFLFFFHIFAGGWATAEGSVAAMMKEAAKFLAMGIGIVVFPEGTRSVDGRMQPFRDGFFRLAIETNAEILPCGLSFCLFCGEGRRDCACLR